MKRPLDYEEVRVTVRNLTYQCEDEHFGGMAMAGGVLSKGQLVWIRNRPAFGNTVSAYVEGIGLVRIDSRFLVRVKDGQREINIAKLPDSNIDPAGLRH